MGDDSAVYPDYEYMFKRATEDFRLMTRQRNELQEKVSALEREKAELVHKVIVAKDFLCSQTNMHEGVMGRKCHCPWCTTLLKLEGGVK